MLKNAFSIGKSSDVYSFCDWASCALNFGFCSFLLKKTRMDSLEELHNESSYRLMSLRRSSLDGLERRALPRYLDVSLLSSP